MARGVAGLIPARWESSRFPGKPLAKILGKSLIQRTFEAAEAGGLDQVIVATDDKRIFDHVRDFGGEAVMTSKNCPTGTDRLAEAASHPLARDAEILVNIQGDWPCVPPEAIQGVVDALRGDPEAVMGSVAMPLLPEELSNPHTVKCSFDSRGRALSFSRTPLPTGETPYRHLGLYSYRRDFLLRYPTLPPTPLQQKESLEQLKALEHGYTIALKVVDETGPSVDRPEDIEKVEKYLTQLEVVD